VSSATPMARRREVLPNLDDFHDQQVERGVAKSDGCDLLGGVSSTLIATSRSSFVSRARYTSPMPPAPIAETIVLNRAPRAAQVFRRQTLWITTLVMIAEQVRTGGSATWSCGCRVGGSTGCEHSDAYHRRCGSRRWSRPQARSLRALRSREAHGHGPRGGSVRGFRMTPSDSGSKTACLLTCRPRTDLR
jgi:hypothetical protein